MLSGGDGDQLAHHLVGRGLVETGIAGEDHLFALGVEEVQEGLTSALLAEHFSTTPTVVERARRDPGHRPPGRQR